MHPRSLEGLHSGSSPWLHKLLRNTEAWALPQHEAQGVGPCTCTCDTSLGDLRPSTARGKHHASQHRGNLESWKPSGVLSYRSINGLRKTSHRTSLCRGPRYNGLLLIEIKIFKLEDSVIPSYHRE